MNPKTKFPLQKSKHTVPLPAEEANTQKIKAEEIEVAGRHRNVGQKDHKGAR